MCSDQVLLSSVPVNSCKIFLQEEFLPEQEQKAGSAIQIKILLFRINTFPGEFSSQGKFFGTADYICL